MRNLLSPVADFIERHTRPGRNERDSLATLSEDIHRQAEAQEWDAEDNTEEAPPLMCLRTDANYATIQTTPGSGVYSLNPNVVWYDEAASFQTIETYDYTFALSNGQEIRIKLIENQQAVEILYDNNIMDFITDVGKITLRRAFDEENNASQDTGVHEESDENSSHGGTNVLLGDGSISLTYTEE